jgi:hypothetical protein
MIVCRTNWTLIFCQVAPVKLRGGLGTVNQLAVTFGIFTSMVLGLEEALGSSGQIFWNLQLQLKLKKFLKSGKYFLF